MTLLEPPTRAELQATREGEAGAVPERETELASQWSQPQRLDRVRLGERLDATARPSAGGEVLGELVGRGSGAVKRARTSATLTLDR